MTAFSGRSSKRNVAEAFEQAHAIGLRGCRSCAAGQHDEWKVRPWRLALLPTFPELAFRRGRKASSVTNATAAPSPSLTSKSSMSSQTTLSILFSCEMLRCRLRIASDRREHQDTVFELFSVCRHRHLSGMSGFGPPTYVGVPVRMPLNSVSGGPTFRPSDVS